MQPNLHAAIRFSRRAIFSSGVILLAGCQSFTTASSSAHLRVIDLSQGAAAIDVYQGGHAIAYNLAYGAVTSFVPLLPGASTTTVTLAGSNQVLSVNKEDYLAGAQYTMLVSGPLANLQQVVLAGHPPADTPSIRIVHQAERVGSVDIYLNPAGHRLSSAAPLILHLLPGTSTGYLPVSLGLSAAIVLPAGTRLSSNAHSLHTGRQTEYVKGLSRTLILLDAPPALVQSLEVIEVNDTDPTNDVR